MTPELSTEWTTPLPPIFYKLLLEVWRLHCVADLEGALGLCQALRTRSVLPLGGGALDTAPCSSISTLNLILCTEFTQDAIALCLE